MDFIPCGDVWCASRHFSVKLKFLTEWSLWNPANNKNTNVEDKPRWWRELYYLKMQFFNDSASPKLLLKSQSHTLIVHFSDVKMTFMRGKRLMNIFLIEKAVDFVEVQRQCRGSDAAPLLFRPVFIQRHLCKWNALLCTVISLFFLSFPDFNRTLSTLISPSAYSWVFHWQREVPEADPLPRPGDVRHHGQGLL